MTVPGEIEASAPVTPQPMQVDAPFNRTAIVAIVAAFVLPFAGIAVGLLALSQVRRTGERGRPLALAATVLSTLFTIGGILAIVVYGIRLANLAGL